MTTPTIAGLSIAISGATFSAATGALADAPLLWNLVVCAGWGAIGAMTRSSLRDDLHRRP
ncbi:hypothetical protein [Patulibacter minatonensis]|uniref:hypothetical protein n=1 Tax=Patulibacter minatonensis TaxID=298163 RepID=UPI00056292DA|nr:hypothetical protein [Patulibacter minatonensis]